MWIIWEKKKKKNENIHIIFTLLAKIGTGLSWEGNKVVYYNIE